MKTDKKLTEINVKIDLYTKYISEGGKYRIDNNGNKILYIGAGYYKKRLGMELRKKRLILKDKTL